jgi:RimJ/RimL family protein N-acetyltransferase
MGPGASHGTLLRVRRVEPETLTTERLVLRPYDRGDEDGIVALLTDPDVMQFVGDGVFAPDRAHRVFAKVFDLYRRGAWGIWAVAERDTGRLVGSAEIKPRPNDDWEIVYILGRDAWGRGYATELGRELVRFGFERLALDRVTATVDYANAVSIRVLEKLGMRQIGEESDDIGAYAVFGVDRAGRPPSEEVL